MAKKKSKTLEEMFPDPEIRERIREQLYSGGPLFGEGSFFSEMLQAMLNASLDGEMEHFQEEEKASGKINRRNGYTTKQVRSTAGPLEIKTPRDREAEFNPVLIGKRQRSLPSGMEEITDSARPEVDFSTACCMAYLKRAAWRLLARNAVVSSPRSL